MYGVRYRTRVFCMYPCTVRYKYAIMAGNMKNRTKTTVFYATPLLTQTQEGEGVQNGD